MIKIDVDKNKGNFRIEASGNLPDLVCEFCKMTEEFTNGIAANDDDAVKIFREAMLVALGIEKLKALIGMKDDAEKDAVEKADSAEEDKS